MSFIKTIDVGKLHCVREMLCDGLEESEKVNGCYRNIEELLLMLAEFYLSNDQYKMVTLSEPNAFHIALGADGAPFGKDDSACSWLVSILNIGHEALSSNENVLLFGANCSENCQPVINFLIKLMIDIHKIENTTYSITFKGEVIHVKFVISELPNDMKMLAYLAGELSNRATYFSTFADANKQTLATMDNLHYSNASWEKW